MDRFFICLSMGYPNADEEIEILRHLGDRTPYEEVEAVASPEILKALRQEAAAVQVSENCSRYIVELVQKKMCIRDRVTVLLYRYKDRSDRFLFLMGTVLGGAYEYLCSVMTEMLFGTVFWDYSSIPFNLSLIHI